jgi:hypothetical protein
MTTVEFVVDLLQNAAIVALAWAVIRTNRTLRRYL